MKANEGITMRSYNNKLKFNEVLLIFLFSLYIINFYGKGFYILILVIPFVIFYSLRVKYSKRFLITLSFICIFGILYGFIMHYYNIISFDTALSLAVFPTIIYILGYTIGEKDYNYFKTYIMFFSILLFINIFIGLSYLRTLAEFGSIETARSILNIRGLMSAWGKSYIKATEITVYLSFNLSLIPSLFVPNTTLSKNRMLIVKIISFIYFAFSLFITLQLGSRTAVIIVVFSCIAVYLFLLKPSVKNLILSFIAFFTLLLLRFLFNLNIFNLKSWWESTAAYARFIESGLESGRFDAWIDVIKGSLNHPMGGRKIDLSISSAHNLWLDVIYDAGIFPFIILIIFTLISIGTLIKFLLNEHPLYIKVLFVSFFIAFIVSFLTEPILRGGERYYFVTYCLYIGIIQGLNKNKQVENI